MYTFKKMLALVLAMLMICSCMVFTTVAADASTEQTDDVETIVPITTCETTDGFTAGGSTGVVDTTDPWAGKASLATTFTGVGGKEAGAIKYQFRGDTIYDATAMKTLVFDIYLSDAAAFENVRFEVELRGNGQSDDDEYRSDVTLTAISGTVLDDGWNHIEISIADMTKSGNPNMKDWNYFRIYNKDEIGLSGETYVFKLDNVYMTSRDKVVPDSTGSGKVRVPATFSFTGISGSSDSQYKNVKNLGGLDISMTDALQFDVRITSEQTNDMKFAFEMTSMPDRNSKRMQTGTTRTLAELIGERVAADGEWHTVSIPLRFFFNADGNSMMNMKNLNFFQVYNVPTDGVTETGDVEFRKFCFVKEETVGEYVIWDARSQAQTADGTEKQMWLKDGSPVEGYQPSISDVDGDGLNEWVLVNVEGNGTIHKQGGWTASGSTSAIKSALLLTPHVGYSNMTSIKFDLYIGNEILIDKKLSVELCSAGGTDKSEISSSKTLRAWFGDDLKVGWNTVEMSLSKFDKKTDGATGPFACAAFNYIRIMSDDNYDFEGGISMAICNIKAVRTVEIVEEIPLGETEKIKMDNATRTANIALGEDADNLALSFFVTNADNGYTQATANYSTVNFPTKLNMTGCDRVYLDLYLENYEVFADVSGFAFEFSSAGKADNNEFSAAGKTIAQVFKRVDGQPLQNGWNAVYSELTLQDDGGIWKDGAGPSGGTYGNADPIDKTKVNYMRVYVSPDVNVDGIDCMAAIDNLRFVNTNLQDAADFPEVKIKNAKLNLQNAFNIIYTAEIHETMKGAGFLFEVTDAYGTLISKQVVGQKGEGLNEMTFTYENIYPQNMTDNIATTLWAVNYEGKLTVDKVTSYSVKEYCSNLLAGIADGTVEDNDGTLATLLCDTLLFGAALQEYTGYNTDDLATDGVDLSAATDNYIPPSFFPKLKGEQGTCPATFYSAFAAIENIYKLRIAFRAEDVTGLKLNFAPNTGDEIIVIDEFEVATVDDGNGGTCDVYVAELPIRPYELELGYVITFEGYEDYMLIYSLGTYLASQHADTVEKLAAETDSDVIDELTCYKNLLESIVIYGTSAKNYAANQQ